MRSCCRQTLTARCRSEDYPESFLRVTAIYTLSSQRVLWPAAVLPASGAYLPTGRRKRRLEHRLERSWSLAADAADGQVRGVTPVRPTEPNPTRRHAERTGALAAQASEICARRRCLRRRAANAAGLDAACKSQSEPVERKTGDIGACRRSAGLRRVFAGLKRRFTPSAGIIAIRAAKDDRSRRPNG